MFVQNSSSRPLSLTVLSFLISRRFIGCFFLFFVLLSLILFSASLYGRVIVDERAGRAVALPSAPVSTLIAYLHTQRGSDKSQLPPLPAFFLPSPPLPPSPSSHEHGEGGEEHDHGGSEAAQELAAPHSHVFDSSHNHSHEVLSAEVQRRIAEREVKDAETLVTCQRWQREWEIDPGKSWGKATAEQAGQWHQADCDGIIGLASYRKYIAEHPELALPVAVPADRVAPANKSTGLPLVAICVCTTTRGLHISELSELALFKSLLPSIAETVESGYEYWVYLLYDVGDAFFDSPQHLQLALDWFSQHVQQPLSARERPVATRLLLTPYRNTARKPGPAFNYVTHLAFIDGADYIYRINDDTYFLSPFTSAFVSALTALGPPYGAVGPMCREGNTGILTHDFTHRTHHLIFTHHYPPALTDWWMDDWISRVYGKRRTRRVEAALVKHLISSHGRRYEVDPSNLLLLGGEVEVGRQAVERFMLSNALHQQLQEYQSDEFRFFT